MHGSVVSTRRAGWCGAVVRVEHRIDPEVAEALGDTQPPENKSV